MTSLFFVCKPLGADDDVLTQFTGSRELVLELTFDTKPEVTMGVKFKK